MPFSAHAEDNPFMPMAEGKEEKDITKFLCSEFLTEIKSASVTGWYSILWAHGFLSGREGKVGSIDKEIVKVFTLTLGLYCSQTKDELFIKAVDRFYTDVVAASKEAAAIKDAQ